MIRGISQECHGIAVEYHGLSQNIMEYQTITMEYHGYYKVSKNVIGYLWNIADYSATLCTLSPGPEGEGPMEGLEANSSAEYAETTR